MSFVGSISLLCLDYSVKEDIFYKSLFPCKEKRSTIHYVLRSLLEWEIEKIKKKYCDFQKTEILL